MGDTGGGVSIVRLTTASAHNFGLKCNHRVTWPELTLRRHDGVKVTYIAKVKLCELHVYIAANTMAT